MRERLPSGFRLGNKGLSGQLALLPGGGGRTQQEDMRVARVGGAELLGGLLPSSGVRENPGWILCLLQACRHPSTLSSAKLGQGVGWLFTHG